MNVDHQKVDTHHGKLRSTTSLSQAIKKMESENKHKHVRVDSKPLEVNGSATFGFPFDANEQEEMNCENLQVPAYLQNEYSRLIAQGVVSLPAQSPDAMFPTSAGLGNQQLNALKSPGPRN